MAAEFVAADATAYALGSDAVPDLVVVNPPRRGIGPDLAGWLEASGVRHVVYSSCNAESLARDLALMPSLRPVEARVLDMFPHTTHYEVMVLLAALSGQPRRILGPLGDVDLAERVAMAVVDVGRRRHASGSARQVDTSDLHPEPDPARRAEAGGRQGHRPACPTRDPSCARRAARQSTRSLRRPQKSVDRRWPGILRQLDAVGTVRA